MSIYLLRHAESEFNVNNKSKKKDCNITKYGIKQCRKLKCNIKFDIILCSPLTRTKQTLKYCNLKYKKLEYLELIREYKSNLCDFYKNEPEIYENEEQLIKRINKIKKLLKQYIKQYPNKNILVIAHADIFWYLTSKVTQGERFGTWYDNCELSELELEHLDIIE